MTTSTVSSLWYPFFSYTFEGFSDRVLCLSVSFVFLGYSLVSVDLLTQVTKNKERVLGEQVSLHYHCCIVVDS